MTVYTVPSLKWRAPELTARLPEIGTQNDDG
jgi:hypothetical protein